eukprot:1157761-Pelagomonas_calceolata.AAC.4
MLRLEFELMRTMEEKFIAGINICLRFLSSNKNDTWRVPWSLGCKQKANRPLASHVAVEARRTSTNLRLPGSGVLKSSYNPDATAQHVLLHRPSRMKNRMLDQCKLFSVVSTYLSVSTSAHPPTSLHPLHLSAYTSSQRIHLRRSIFLTASTSPQRIHFIASFSSQHIHLRRSVYLTALTPPQRIHLGASFSSQRIHLSTSTSAHPTHLGASTSAHPPRIHLNLIECQLDMETGSLTCRQSEGVQSPAGAGQQHSSTLGSVHRGATSTQTQIIF